MSGYLRAQRDRFDHPLFRSEKFCRGYAWDWLVAHAAYKDTQIEVKGRIVTIRRGQLCYSIRYIAKAWNWSRSATERFIARLETETMVGTDSGAGQMVITICNYDRYQSGGDECGTATGTTSGTAAGQQRDSSGTNKKEREEKTRKEEEESSSPSGDLLHANPVSEAVTAYNAAAERQGWPKVQKVTPSRRKAVLARLRDVGGVDGWAHAMDRAEMSDFLCGRTHKPWTGFGFDWVCKPANFTKLMEGNYDNRGCGRSESADRQGWDSDTIDAIAYAAGFEGT